MREGPFWYAFDTFSRHCWILIERRRGRWWYGHDAWCRKRGAVPGSRFVVMTWRQTFIASAVAIHPPVLAYLPFFSNRSSETRTHCRLPLIIHHSSFLGPKARASIARRSRYCIRGLSPRLSPYIRTEIPAHLKSASRTLLFKTISGPNLRNLPCGILATREVTQRRGARGTVSMADRRATR